jgi:Tfp pilus assembly protein PilN
MANGHARLMAFLQPDVLVERLMAEIDRIANTPCPLAQREQRIAKLEEEIDQLQRTEEAIVLPPVRHARLDARHGSCWVLRPQRHPASAPRDVPVTASTHKRGH